MRSKTQKERALGHCSIGSLLKKGFTSSIKRNSWETRAWVWAQFSCGRIKTSVKPREDAPMSKKEKVAFQWLNTKAEDSATHVSFGSMNKFPSSQLIEIAHGLESAGHDSPGWFPRRKKGDEGAEFLEEFENRVKGTNKGYVFKGWAPQSLVLNHPATGGTVTHCGWNTIVKTVNAGLPMVTWPLIAEQFGNEELLVDVLKIAVVVPVGSKEWRNWTDFAEEAVKREEDIRKAVASKMEKKLKKPFGGGNLFGGGRISQEAKKAIEAGGFGISF